MVWNKGARCLLGCKKKPKQMEGYAMEGSEQGHFHVGSSSGIKFRHPNFWCTLDSQDSSGRFQHAHIHSHV